tara:strand:+ start:203 stop:946 length:744 start_codon:yes stop_codon:yes gene_type:complete
VSFTIAAVEQEIDLEINTEIIDETYQQRRFVFFDIETIPCQDDAYRAVLATNIKPPASIKKPESIEKWFEEKGDATVQDAMSKTSFDGGRGHVCTIAWAKNMGDIQVAHAENVGEEKSVLQAFFDDLDRYHNETLVGHNITGFDIGFLRKRAIVLGVALPPNSCFPRDPKPWEKNVQDTMIMWAGGRGTVSMDNLCGFLGIEGKDGFDGSMVADAWVNGEHAKIAEYCIDDVMKTRLIHRRFMGVQW